MPSLQELVQTYLGSLGFNLLQREEGFVVADRVGYASERETWLVWIPKSPRLPEDYKPLERSLLGAFQRIISQYPKGKYFVVSETLEGYSRPFGAEARRQRVTLTVPGWFFDAPFKQESVPSYRSAFTPLLESDELGTRVPQPFRKLAGDQPREQGDDLLPHLRQEIVSAKEPCLRIVVGPAGMGKSVLFGSLFSQLYIDFQQKKLKRTAFPRPIPFIPAYLRQAVSIRADALLDEFLRTDVAAPLQRDSFKWMAVNGFTTWLFDGLDELYAGDPNFFHDIADLLTSAGAKAQILICARESLLTSCATFSEFLKEFRPGLDQAVQVYRLTEWERESKRQFAWFRFEKRLPAVGEAPSPKVSAFLNWVESSQPLKELSGVPYYAGLLADEFNEGRTQSYREDYSLIQRAVDSLIKREEEKGVFSASHFEPNGLTEWLEEVAFHYFQGGLAGLTVEEVRDYAELIIHGGVPTIERNKLVISLIQFPLFSRGQAVGLIGFKHELVCEYLAGRFILRRIRTDPAWAARSLGGRADLADSLIVRYVAHDLPEQPGSLQALIEALRGGAISGQAFANLLQILLLANPRKDLIRAEKLVLEGRDLSHLRFVERDLQTASFRNSNLTNTLFKNCDLRDAHFEGAYLVGTKFEGTDKSHLKGATFGSLEHFGFVLVSGKEIDEPADAANWVRAATGVTSEIAQPCPAAFQLRTLFLKFVEESGAGRRDELREESLHRGKRFRGAPTPGDCIEAARRFGYVEPAVHRGRLKRTTGDKYAEIVQFVTNWRLSAQLRQLLNSMCMRNDCPHVPGAV